MKKKGGIFETTKFETPSNCHFIQDLRVISNQWDNPSNTASRSHVKNAEWVVIFVEFLHGAGDVCAPDNTLHLLCHPSLGKHKYGGNRTVRQSPCCHLPKIIRTCAALTQRHANNTRARPALQPLCVLSPSAFSFISPTPSSPAGSFSFSFSPRQASNAADKANKEPGGETGQCSGLVSAQRHLQTQEPRGGQRGEGSFR